MIATAGAVHDFSFVFDEAVAFNLIAVKLALVGWVDAVRAEHQMEIPGQAQNVVN